MVVCVRKNRMLNMLLFENKSSYIFCVVGAGVTKAEWAWWFVKLHQRCWLACWFVYLCVHFNILPGVLWNLNQLWLGYSFDSGVIHLLHNASGMEVLALRKTGTRARRFEWQPFRQLSLQRSLQHSYRKANSTSQKSNVWALRKC